MTVTLFPIAGRRGFATIALRALAVAIASMALSGCYTAQTAVKTEEAAPVDYRKRHPIAIREGERVVKIFIGTSRGGLTPAQRAEVLAFAQTWKNEATGGIIIELPTGTPNAVAASDSLREIRSILVAAGLPANGIGVTSYQPSDPEKLAVIKIKYSKMVAEAGPCGLWPQDLGPTTDRIYIANSPYWNLGCSSQRNLASMVDNPADLVQPRAETPPYAARRNVVFDKYKKGQDPSTIYQGTDKAKLSDLGK
jgi:pilus assembly protein CpaD